MSIHLTAIIEPGARLHETVSVGPFSIIESNVEIGAGCSIESHVRIYSGTRMGENNRVCHGAMLGCEPQDFTFDPKSSKPLVIGNDNHFKEGVNVSRGVKTEAGTLIGDHNYFMGNFHAGHDCIIGNHNILGHGSGLAGHVIFGDHINLAPMTAIHQFVQIGDWAMLAGMAKIVKDIPPFVIGDGNPARVSGINSIGLRRSGFPPELRSAIKRAYKTLYQSKLNISQALAQLKSENQPAEVAQIINFFEQSDRGVTAHR
ncbi:MAG: acyl-ACP--UDP-N-acetylglucosamine O-acyltransferase [Gammaproteobacteria bacterium]|nr:acyl-ACP--UDP-N-acetylglucosamine O-acyltransferase [Gammaproteobacteria bacterium]